MGSSYPPQGWGSIVDQLVTECGDGLGEAGFLVKDCTHHVQIEKVVGYEMDSTRGRLYFPLERAGVFRESLQWLVSKPVIDTSVLASIVGLWVWGALSRRELLSIPRDVFQIHWDQKWQPPQMVVKWGVPSKRSRAWRRPSGRCMIASPRPSRQISSPRMPEAETV